MCEQRLMGDRAFFSANFFPLGNKEKGATMLYIGFFGAKMWPYF
jgi:hypothetical protein